MAELVLGGLAGSFLYNRENFMFDRKLQLKREFQGQGMRIKQFALYREDVRDLMGLTVSKMDNYLIVSTLQLGLCITILTEGRPRTNESPPWLLWLYAVTIMGAFLYFLMCAWLAMHASIAAHSFGVRMLTQFVRLPVPSTKQMDAARAFATDFEGSQMRNIFRIPVVKQQMRRFNEAMDNLTIQEAAAEQEAPSEAGPPESERSDELPTRTPAATVLRQHTRLYRELQANWQAYDAYARVCMALGTNQLLNALGYDLLQLLIVYEHEPFSALSCALICAVAAWLLARLDLWLSPRLLALAAVLLAVPPVLAMISLTIDEEHSPPALVGLAKFLVLVVFLIHIVWISFMVYIAKADHFGSLSLPKNFRSVLYLDVFGQMAEEGEEEEEEAGEAANPGEERALGMSPAAGSAGGLREELLPTVEEHGTSFPRQWSRSSANDSACGLQRQISLSRTNLRTSLANLCWRLRAEFERELRHWEEPNLTEVLGDDLPELSDVSQLRGRLDAVTSQLRELAPDLAMEPWEGNEAREDEDARAKIWLKLEWNPSGQATEYFYCCDTGVNAFIRPREPDRVLELEVLDEQLKELEGKARALSELPLQPEEPPEAAPPPAPPSPPLQTLPACPPLPPSSSAATTIPKTSAAASAPSSPAEVRHQALDPDVEEDGPAQETQFGGREAVPYASAVADQNFHPHQPGTREDARRQRRPPGQLPWHTFLKGSLVLIFVYVIGVLWYVSTIFGIDIPVDPPAPLPDPGLTLLSAGPHRFFNPTSVVCDDASKSLLVAERFAVHEVSLEAASLSRNSSEFKQAQEESVLQPSIFRPALAECLGHAPDFHAAGIRSISLDCTESNAPDARGRCSVLLLGAQGHEALRCSVGRDVEASRTPQRVTVHGGQWAFVASSSGEALWARREHDGALFMMQQRGGALLPYAEAELDHAGRTTLLQLVGVGSELLLGLEPEGALRAWPVAGGEPLWSAHLGTGVRWLDLCVAGEAAYLLGTLAVARRQQQATPALWRLALPPELRQLAAAA